MTWYRTLVLWLRQMVRPSQEPGQALVEYALIFVLCIIVCLSILNVLSSNIYENYWKLIQAMP